MIASLLALLAVAAVALRKMGGYATLAAGEHGTEGAAAAHLIGHLGQPPEGALGSLRFVNGKTPGTGDYLAARDRLAAALHAEGYTVITERTPYAQGLYKKAPAGELALVDAKNHRIYLNTGTAQSPTDAKQQLLKLSDAAARIGLGERATVPSQHVVHAATSNAILHRLGFNGSAHHAARIHQVTGGTPAHHSAALINNQGARIRGAAHSINRHIATPGRAHPAIRRGGRPSGAQTAAAYRGATRPATRRGPSQPGRGPGRPKGSKNKTPKEKRPRGRPTGTRDRKPRHRATKQEREAGYSRAKTPPKGYQKP